MVALVDNLAFGVALQRRRATLAWHGLVRRDPVALLEMWSGRIDPYRHYERMRTAGPIFRSRVGAWVTTSHRLCNEVLRDRRFGVRERDAPPGSGPTEMSFLGLDPPDHTRLRRLVAPAFSPRRIAQHRPRIEEVAARLVDRAAGKATFDLMADIAMPLPVAVIADLLGLRQADGATLARYGRTVVDALDGIRSLRQSRQLHAARAELDRTFASVVAQRRREPTDDLVSQLAAAEGENLTSAELLSLCTLLLVAGFDTTVNLLGNTVNALLAHPDQWALLRADPTLARQAVEETLRFDPPLQRTCRVAHEPVELGGVPVQAGEWVYLLLAAANRDTEVYSDPNRFDITRQQGVEHLAFSGGGHYCPGAPLARLEGEVLLAMLAGRMDLLPGRPGRRRRSATIRGFHQLPVVAGATARSTATSIHDGHG